MKSSKMSDLEKNARMSVLKEARDMAAHAMGQKLKGGLAQAHVISSSTDGLAKGLDKAKDLLNEDGMPDGMDHMTQHMDQSPAEAHPSEIDYDDHRDGERDSEDSVMEPEEMPKDEPDMEEISEHPMDSHHVYGEKDEMEVNPSSESEEDELDEVDHNPNEMKLDDIERELDRLHGLRAQMKGKK